MLQENTHPKFCQLARPSLMSHKCPTQHPSQWHCLFSLFLICLLWNKYKLLWGDSTGLFYFPLAPDRLGDTEHAHGEHLWLYCISLPPQLWPRRVNPTGNSRVSSQGWTWVWKLDRPSLSSIWSILWSKRRLGYIQIQRKNNPRLPSTAS